MTDGKELRTRSYGYQLRDVERPSLQNRAFREGDDHYRSWRDRQIDEYDRDYEAFCRERQAQFNADFGAWRLRRQAGKEVVVAPVEENSGTTDVGAAREATRRRDRSRRQSAGRRKQ